MGSTVLKRDRRFCIRSAVWGLAVGLLLLTTGCSQSEDRLFTRRAAEQTGVDFANTIPEDDSLMNPLDFFYVYNGGGVAAGDLNGDGRTDLYFAGNAVQNRLYLNEGDFQFRDVTGAAGVAAPGGWSTGVTLVDINQDGRTDIYVSLGGPREVVDSRANRLYVNRGTGPDGIPTFEEQAEEYGIADAGYSTHAAFFDADRDRDLDLYVLNTATVRSRGQAGEASGSNQDHFYRNTGSESGMSTFTEVSDAAGITQNGYGLGLAISDVNNDGWPDVYAANDLHTRDHLYLNDGDGTFTERSRRYQRHQSYSAMGVDIADVNNDQREDIFVLDMLPQDRRRRGLVSTEGASTDQMWQYVRNTLQLNNGVGPEGMASFSDVGQLAGIEATGWSWAPLLADYDNDGDRDLFVSNGFGELITHLDFAQQRQKMQGFGSRGETPDALHELMDELPVVHLPNRFFENDGHAGTDGESLHFTERTGTWAASRPGISNGAVFADLDRDGDLDLVTNNVNDEATLLENKANTRSDAHALRVDLQGPKGNRSGLGAEVQLTNDGTTQSHDHSPYRGYQSTVEGIVHFGLGADSTADSLRVTWPDGTTQLRTDVAAGRVLTVQYDSVATAPDAAHRRPSDSALFRAVAAQRGLAHRHRETGGRERNALLPHQYTKNGPGIAVGDVDGNGLDDIFVGADRGRERMLYRQTAPGEFQQRSLAMKHRYSGTYGYEDMGALFFDADGDGDLDLYVVSGSNVGPLSAAGEAYQDRLYLNEGTRSRSGTGTGQFRRAEGALPDVTTSGSVVTAADYDRDGDLDLFVGGRVRPGEYPLPPRSYVLRNDSGENGVQFTDVTAEMAPGLAELGLVSDALWTDYNGDGRSDLLVVGEWMPITLFENTGDQFTDVTDEAGLQNTSGWWNSLASGDFDRDGDTEYVAGNLGLNTRYEASPEAPVRVHAKDFDQDGQLDPVLSRYVEGTNVPAHNYKELTTQLRRMEQRFPSHRAYAEASFNDVFPASDLEGSYEATTVRFETTYLDPASDGTFSLRALPRPVQMAPVFGMQTGDYNDDGHLDLLAVGNWYAPDAETGRADASIGTVLRGTGTGHFDPIPYPESGFLVGKDAKGLSTVATGSDSALVVAVQNNDSLRVFAPTHRRGHYVSVRPLDRYAMLTYEDGSTRREELHYGSTYLSQSSRQLWVPASVTKVMIHGAEGTRHVALGKR